MKILDIDLGKYNSAACLLETETQETLFLSFKFYPQEFLNLLTQAEPDSVDRKSTLEKVYGWV